jgi:hypothetical protein
MLSRKLSRSLDSNAHQNYRLETVSKCCQLPLLHTRSQSAESSASTSSSSSSLIIINNTAHFLIGKQKSNKTSENTTRQQFLLAQQERVLSNYQRFKLALRTAIYLQAPVLKKTRKYLIYQPYLINPRAQIHPISQPNPTQFKRALEVIGKTNPTSKVPPPNLPE